MNHYEPLLTIINILGHHVFQKTSQVVSKLKADRQTLLWSATWPVSIQDLVKDFCKEQWNWENPWEFMGKPMGKP